MLDDCPFGFCPEQSRSVVRRFHKPPDSAKPRTWWHWTNGNVSEAGITKDLEWMKRSGIGGFQLVDVAAGSGQIVEPKINFGTPEWYNAVLHITMDSWEAGMQNWTDEMIAELQRRRGYDPTPYLPILAGRVVGSADVSDRFLWEFRRTLADMYAEEFYGTMDSELHKRGMEAYSEASGVALEIPEDTLLNKSKVDIPMAEFWVHALHPESIYYVGVRGAASAAQVYGKPIVAEESFTGGGYESPYTLKKIADYWFAQGVNLLVFHTSAHQPLDTKPGNTMVGTHINRNITWAEQARPFMTYVARVSYMLQQGSPAADIAYLLPEGALPQCRSGEADSNPQLRPAMTTTTSIPTFFFTTLVSRRAEPSMSTAAAIFRKT